MKQKTKVFSLLDYKLALNGDNPDLKKYGVGKIIKNLNVARTIKSENCLVDFASFIEPNYANNFMTALSSIVEQYSLTPFHHSSNQVYAYLTLISQDRCRSQPVFGYADWQYGVESGEPQGLYKRRSATVAEHHRHRHPARTRLLEQRAVHRCPQGP